MSAGAGKYDAECTKARESTGADSAILIVTNGTKGSGFAVQATPADLVRLPDMLETMAKQIRADLERS